MGSWTFAYDHLNRLLSGTPTSGVYSGQGQELCLDYDSFGNRTQSDLQTTACKPDPTPSVANSAYDPNTAKYSVAIQVMPCIAMKLRCVIWLGLGRGDAGPSTSLRCGRDDKCGYGARFWRSGCSPRASR